MSCLKEIAGRAGVSTARLSCMHNGSGRVGVVAEKSVCLRRATGEMRALCGLAWADLPHFPRCIIESKAHSPPAVTLRCLGYERHPPARFGVLQVYTRLFPMPDNRDKGVRNAMGGKLTMWAADVACLKRRAFAAPSGFSTVSCTGHDRQRPVSCAGPWTT